MDKDTISALTALAKSALDAGHRPTDAFALVSGLFNLVVPTPAAAKLPSDLMQRIINAPSNQPVQQAIQSTPTAPAGFIGALPAGE